MSTVIMYMEYCTWFCARWKNVHAQQQNKVHDFGNAGTMYISVAIVQLATKETSLKI